MLIIAFIRRKRAVKPQPDKKAFQRKYDSDILPADLNTYGGEALRILEQLQSQNEKWFEVTFLLTNLGESEEQVKLDALQAKAIASKHNCELAPYGYNQENCLMSCLPIGLNLTYPRRGLTTSAVAVFVPFTTQELYMEPPSVYYGLNTISNNMIMADRKRLPSPNGLVLGTPGSGKSFAAKREILINCLASQDDIIICDPEGEELRQEGAM
jgi:hypothetical protein